MNPKKLVASQKNLFSSCASHHVRNVAAVLFCVFLFALEGEKIIEEIAFDKIVFCIFKIFDDAKLQTKLLLKNDIRQQHVVFNMIMIIHQLNIANSLLTD
jgi:hypothetical protein